MSDQVTTEESPTTENWGPYHRHFASDAIHRDDGPECNEPGTPKRVYVFDPDYLEEHDQWIRDHAAADNPSVTLMESRVRERVIKLEDELSMAESRPPSSIWGNGLLAGKALELEFLKGLIGDMDADTEDCDGHKTVEQLRDCPICSRSREATNNE